MSDEFNDELMSGGTPWLSFDGKPPVTFKGVITKKEVRQSRDFETGELSFWDAAKTEPKKDIVLFLQTSLRDKTVQGDTGVRQLVCPKGGPRAQAIKAAVLKARANGVNIGDELTITYTHEEPNKNPRLNGVKQFTAVLVPAKAEATEEVLDALLG